jgi:microcystin-dependent protein
VDPFIAEIRIFPFTFAPRGWAFCNGQLLSISQNTALFSLLGTTYGGDGRTTFALPDLRGSAPMHQGQGPGLPNHDLGERGGSTTVTLSQNQMPMHAHAWMGSNQTAEDRTPANEFVARATGGTLYTTKSDGVTPLASGAVTSIGGSQPHNNLQPYLTFNFCIALQGIFPPRS